MIVIGGENLIDYVQKGTEDGLPTYKAIPGGSCFNCAIAIARQDQKVAYLTPISKDTLGQLLASLLKKDGVVLAAPKNNAPTSLAIVSIKNSLPSYQFYRSKTADRMVTLSKLEATTPQEMSIFHVGSMALIEGKDAFAWEKFFINQHSKGILTSIDPNLRPIVVKKRKPYINRLLRMFKHCDILKLSDEDLQYMFPKIPIEESLKNLAKITSAIILILTKGKNGAQVFTKSNFCFSIPAIKAKPLVDTVGAGDTFMGTILGELQKLEIKDRVDLSHIKRVDLTKIMEKAAKAAALNCQHSGCNPPYSKEL